MERFNISNIEDKRTGVKRPIYKARKLMDTE